MKRIFLRIVAIVSLLSITVDSLHTMQQNKDFANQEFSEEDYKTVVNAIQQRNHEQTKAILILSPLLIDIADTNNVTLLDVASNSENIYAFVLIIKCIVEKNIRENNNREKENKIHEAITLKLQVQKQNIPAPQLFLDTNQELIFFEAIIQNNKYLIKRMLIAKRELALITDSINQTPLHLATFFNHIEIIHLLMNYGADPLSCTKKGLSTLHIAAEKNILKL